MTPLFTPFIDKWVERLGVGVMVVGGVYLLGHVVWAVIRG